MGDNWMRLAALYSCSALDESITIRAVVPRSLLAISEIAFGDRIEFTDTATSNALTYTNRGVRDLIPRIARGSRFLVPYHRIVAQDGAKRLVKDKINSFLFDTLDRLGLAQLPPYDALDKYQGYLEAACIRRFRNVPWEAFRTRLIEDYPAICSRIGTEAQGSPKLDLPSDIGERISVFPTGTGHQFMPPDFAKVHLPSAIFWVHERDPYRSDYESLGVQMGTFYEPTDIVVISKSSRVTISTDSFPSHILQFSPGVVTLTLSQVERKRIVHPAFAGNIIDSVAPCCPCPNLERKAWPKCKAGHIDCLTWSRPEYADKLLRIVQERVFK
jgi:hypothetical protein